MMNVLLVFTIDNRTVYFEKANAVRIMHALGCDNWVIETASGNHTFTCANWHVYIQYNENK